jgi:hypothetical protein
MKKVIKLLFLLLCLNLYLIGQEVENGGFEAWENAGTVIDEPVDWSSIKTSDNTSLNGVAPVIWGKSTDAHAGDFSLKLFNISPFAGIIVAGTMTNGRVHSDFNPDLGYVFTDPQDSRWNTPFTVRADSLVGWYKFYPVGQDFGRVQALLHVGYTRIPDNADSVNWVGKADFYMQPGVTIDAWTRFSVPFTYYDDRTPEYILFILNSGNGTTPVEGSWALFDDIATVGEHQSVDYHELTVNTVYFSNNTLYLNNLPAGFLQNATVEIHDLTGRIVGQAPITGTSVSFGSVSFNKGIYLVRIISESGTVSSKIFIY